MKNHFVFFDVDQNQTLNNWLSIRYNLHTFSPKISIQGVIVQHEPVKIRIFSLQSFCQPKPATLKVFAFSAPDSLTHSLN